MASAELPVALRTACDGCRAHHHQCDGAPTCAHCLRRGVPCVRSARRKPGPLPKGHRHARPSGTGAGARRSLPVTRRGAASGLAWRHADLVDDSGMAMFHALFRTTVGSLFAGVDVTSVAAAWRIDVLESSAGEAAEKSLACAIVAFGTRPPRRPLLRGRARAMLLPSLTPSHPALLRRPLFVPHTGARKCGDAALAAEACRRADDLDRQRPALSAHPFAAVAHTVLGSVKLMAGDRPAAERSLWRAYNCTRAPTAPDAADPVWRVADTSDQWVLDTVRLTAGASLLQLAHTTAEAVALINECHQLTVSPFSRAYFLLSVVRRCILAVLQAEQVPDDAAVPDLLDDLYAHLHLLAEATLEVVRGDCSRPAVQLTCQNYLSVQTLVHLLMDDKPAARSAALSILRCVADAPTREPVGHKVLPLVCSLKAFIDLGMPNEVNHVLRALEDLQPIHTLASPVLEYARSGRRPAAAATAVSDALELALLDACFSRPRRVAAARVARSGRHAHILRLEEHLDWSVILAPPSAPSAPSAPFAPSAPLLIAPVSAGASTHTPAAAPSDWSPTVGAAASGEIDQWTYFAEIGPHAGLYERLWSEDEHWSQDEYGFQDDR